VTQMPSGSVHSHHNTRGRQFCSHVREQERHPLAIGIGHNQGADMASVRADGGKDIEGFPDHVPGHDRAERLRSPPSSQGMHEPKPAFIFGHDQNGTRIVRRAGSQHLLDSDWEVFFNVSCAASHVQGS
jgi:hypothetical protein